MNVKQLDHLNLTVNNLDETSDWYSRVFGFDIVEDGHSGDIAFRILRAGDAMLCTYAYPGQAFHDRFESRRREVHGINHFALRITDERAWLNTVEREGLKILYEGKVAHPHSDAWYVYDPTGYEIEVVLWHDDVIAFG